VFTYFNSFTPIPLRFNAVGFSFLAFNRRIIFGGDSGAPLGFTFDFSEVRRIEVIAEGV
jgi:hypothetical protein